jgi:hypothetical protein
MEVSGHFHAPAALPLGKEPPVRIGLEVGWVPEPVWTRCRRVKFTASAEFEPQLSDRPARSQSLYRPSYPGSLTMCEYEIKESLKTLCTGFPKRYRFRYTSAGKTVEGSFIVSFNRVTTL